MFFEKAAAASITLAALLVFAVSPLSQQQVALRPSNVLEEPVEKNGSVSMDAQIERWIHAIADQEHRNDWLDARWEKHALGPGTHGWVIVLKNKKSGDPIGYLVVHAADEKQWQLTEYGFDDYPLFGEETLYDALVRDGLVSESTTALETFLDSIDAFVDRRYDHPLQSYWTVEINGSSYIYDAKTGEAYTSEHAKSGSVDDFTPAPIVPTQLNVSTSTKAEEPFNDVFWLLPSSSNENKSFHQLADAMMEGRNIVFVASLFAGQVKTPLSLTGIREWSSGSQAVAVDHYGPRIIAFASLTKNGIFHINQTSNHHGPHDV